MSCFLNFSCKVVWFRWAQFLIVTFITRKPNWKWVVKNVFSFFCNLIFSFQPPHWEYIYIFLVFQPLFTLEWMNNFHPPTTFSQHGMDGHPPSNMIICWLGGNFYLFIPSRSPFFLEFIKFDFLVPFQLFLLKWVDLPLRKSSSWRIK
jgi:hypothetical protein